MVINRSAGGKGTVAETLIDSSGELFSHEGLKADIYLVAGADFESTCQDTLGDGGIGIAVGGEAGPLVRRRVFSLMEKFNSGCCLLAR